MPRTIAGEDSTGVQRTIKVDTSGNLITTAGTSATSLGKAEDAAHTGGDTGVMVLAVRNDTPSALAGTDGDYIPLTTDSLGHLRTRERRASSATVTSANDAASSATLLAALTARVGFRIFNDSTSILYVKYGTTASTTDYTVRLGPGDYLEENFYTGRVDGIWSADASGAARITEL